MFVLGLDPGLSRCGYCVLSTDGRGNARAAALGVLRTSSELPVWDRLATIQADLRALLAEYPVDAVALERVMFGANARTASGVIQSAGIAMCEAVAVGASVAEYGPNEVKQAVTGWGAAPKDQVAEMVARLLGLNAVIRPVDASDAAAVALCHVARAHRPTAVATHGGGR